MTSVHPPSSHPLAFEGPPPPAAWVNRYASLGAAFYTELPAQGMANPVWLARSAGLAATLGWPADWWRRDDWQALAALSGNTVWPGMRPMATVYSGHQFGSWAGQLGDGRALLLGELDTPAGPQELQLKGAGMTPYSRMGDGRAVLRSSIREFLCSEAMAGLSIPTTRALALTASALPVRRETLETAAVVTRVAPSFIRFGHFEHFAHSQQHAELRQLADFFIRHHAPACADAPRPYAALLEQVVRRTATLMADWQAVGFCHGVMNTDNMSMLGLTLDYGPFGFMDAFDPGHVCNHSDHQGRYAYARQPNIGFWNLHALAQALLPLMPEADRDGAPLLEALDVYKTVFPAALMQRMRAKLGLRSEQATDQALIDDWFKLMAGARADFTQSFRRLSALTLDADPACLRDLFIDQAALAHWLQRYRERLQAEQSIDAQRNSQMLATNPAVVLRNHLAEGAIRAAQAGDFSETERLLKVLQNPFLEPERAADAALPPDWAQTLEVSCSS